MAMWGPMPSMTKMANLSFSTLDHPPQELVTPRDPADGVYPAFAGGNELREIETIEEFHALLQYSLDRRTPQKKEEDVEKVKQGSKVKQEVLLANLGNISMDGWVFQEVNFSKEPLERWELYNFRGASFWGCQYPADHTSHSLTQRGAKTFDNPASLPFRPARAFMYTQEELEMVDDSIYEFYKANTKLGDRIAECVHDFSVEDAMGDYSEGKTIVGFMGGHRLWRHCEEYQTIVWLCRELAKKGLMVVTGGGPGAMEAANLGAYLFDRTDEEVKEALEIIGRDKDESGANYIIPTAQAVLKRFGFPTYQPSLGIPTYYYGHEPTNKFATFQGKFFSNALREAHLLTICNGGIVFTRGAAGTRQEIFQFACQNHYAPENKSTPMIFFGEKWWKSEGVFQLVEHTSKEKEYHDLLLCTDSIDKVVEHCVEHSKKRGLPLLTKDVLREPFWVSKCLRDIYNKQEEMRAKEGEVIFCL